MNEDENKIKEKVNLVLSVLYQPRLIDQYEYEFLEKIFGNNVMQKVYEHIKADQNSILHITSESKPWASY